MFVIAIFLTFVLALVTYYMDADDAQLLGTLGWITLTFVLIAVTIEAF